MDGILNYVLFGRKVLQWALAAAFIAGGFVAGHICSRIVTAILKFARSKTKSTLDDIVIAEIGLPLVLILTLGGIRLGMGFLEMSSVVSLWADRVFAIGIILTFALALDKIAGALVADYLPGKISDPLLKGEFALQPVLKKLFASLVWIIAAVLVLRVLGYNISALLAGLGLGGAALALASKDTLSNFLGSIAVFVDKPFQINDRIKIGNYDGVVTEIGIRTSRLRTLENRIVVIPNSLFTASPIENVSSAPSVKITQTIKVHGNNGSEKIGLALELLQNIQTDGLDGQCIASLVTVGGIVCNITHVFFIAKGADYWGTISGVNLEVLRQFKEADIRLL
jgi:MscS family membrane protein